MDSKSINREKNNDKLSNKNLINNLEKTEGFIKIWIETIIGTAYEVWISKNEQIFNLKLKLEIEEDIPVLHQTLYYGDDELNDSFTIEEYEIEYGATLKLQIQKHKQYQNQISNLESTFTFDEQTYNLLFEDDSNQIKKNNSLTDSKSIDEFRLINASSNLGCISVNENKIEDKDERMLSKKEKMDQLAIRMQKLSFKKQDQFKLPNLVNNKINDTNEIKFNKLKNQKRLSNQFEKKNLTKKDEIKFLNRFRSNSSFNLIIDDNRIENNFKKDDNNNLINRPQSVPIFGKKQSKFNNSIFKSINFTDLQLIDQRSLSISPREFLKDDEINDNLKMEINRDTKLKKAKKIINFNNDNKKEIDKEIDKENRSLDRIKLPIKLPPVELKTKNKNDKLRCSKCSKIIKNSNELCKCSEQGQTSKSDENILINKLNGFKSKKKLLPKL